MSDDKMTPAERKRAAGEFVSALKMEVTVCADTPQLSPRLIAACAKYWEEEYATTEEESLPVVEPDTVKAADFAYESYRGYAHGKHPVTNTPLPPFKALDGQAQAAWGRVAVALKVYYSRD